MSRSTVIGAGASLLVFLLSCNAPRGGATLGKRAAAAAQNSPVKVEVLQPQAANEYLSLAAEVEPWNDSQLTFQTSGIVDRVGVREGDRVQQGQLLATLEDLTQQADLKQARTALEQAELNHQRMEKLYQTHSVSQREYEVAFQTMEAAAAGYRRSLDAWEKTQLLAPFAGTVDRVDARVGTRVNLGSPAVHLLSSGRLRARISIPENDVLYVHSGTEVNMHYQLFNAPPLEFSGTIQSVASKADPKSRSYRAIVDIKDPGGLRAGMMLNAKLVRRSYQEALLLPIFALIPQVDGYAVFVHRDGKAEKRTVQLGAFIGQRVIALSGLQPGEELIVEGQQFLSDGSPVKVTASGEEPIQGQPV